ncbi:flagellar export chaperone FliS [Hydrogenophaga aquatica]
MNYDAYNSYVNVNLGAQTAQASPVQLVLILMSGLQDELARAKAHIEARRHELKALSIDRCVNILNGLASALETDGGGELVENLGELYDYCARRLHAAGVQLDTAPVDEVASLLGTLREGWEGLQRNHG